MRFNKGDRVRFSPQPDVSDRTEQGTVMDVVQDRKGRTFYEVQRDSDPSGPDLFLREDDIAQT